MDPPGPVVAFVAVVVLDVVVAWAFARFFADRGDSLPTLAAWLRLSCAAILAVATTHLTVATQFANLGAADADVSASLVTFSTMWQLGLVVLAAHLAVLATLVIGDADAPTLLGAIIAIAAAAYAADGIARLFLPADAEALTVVTGVVAVASIIGEIGLGSGSWQEVGSRRDGRPWHHPCAAPRCTRAQRPGQRGGPGCP